MRILSRMCRQDLVIEIVMTAMKHYRTELSSQTVDHRKCFPCKVHLHFFADHSIEMQCLIVLLTPGHISAAKLAIGIKFFLFCHAAVFIPPPKEHQRHVLPTVHLLFHFRKVGKLKAQIPSIRSFRISAIDQFCYAIVGNPGRQWIRQWFTLLKRFQEIVDSWFACTYSCCILRVNRSMFTDK